MLKQQMSDSTGQIILHNYNACLTSGIKKSNMGEIVRIINVSFKGFSLG